MRKPYTKFPQDNIRFFLTSNVFIRLENDSNAKTVLLKLSKLHLNCFI